jgi:hypothetical protein
MNDILSARKDAGETFRSRGETQIARCLEHYAIPYLYEQPLAVLDEGKVRLYYPDFQLSGYGMLIEYCGVVGSDAYSRMIRKKQRVYEAGGLDCLFWFPEDFHGDWNRRLLDGIERILAGRLSRFRIGCRQEYSVKRGFRKTGEPADLYCTQLSSPGMNAVYHVRKREISIASSINRTGIPEQGLSPMSLTYSDRKNAADDFPDPFQASYNRMGYAIGRSMAVPVR